MTAGHIRARGPGAWELKYDIGRDPGSGRRLTRYATVRGTKRQAEARLRALMTALDRGEHVDPNRLTVGDHIHARIEQWIESGRISAGTGEHYGHLLRWCIQPHIGPIQLQKLTTLDLEAWHAKLRTAGRRRADTGISASTVRNAHRILSKALAEAVRHGLAIRNIAEIERAPRATVEEVKILDHDQLHAVMARLEGHALQAAVIVALNTGLRRGEQLALDWRDVDLERGVIRVAKALEETEAHGIRIKAPKTKSGRREISLPEIAVAALRAHRRKQLELRMALGAGKMPEDALVFPAVGGDYQSPRGLSLRWRRVVRDLGLPDVGWHALRHTHASMLIDAGVDVVTVSKRLGHASPTITLSTYAHKFRKDDSKAVEAINAAMAGWQTGGKTEFPESWPGGKRVVIQNFRECEITD